MAANPAVRHGHLMARPWASSPSRPYSSQSPHRGEAGRMVHGAGRASQVGTRPWTWRVGESGRCERFASATSAGDAVEVEHPGDLPTGLGSHLAERCKDTGGVHCRLEVGDVRWFWSRIFLSSGMADGRLLVLVLVRRHLHHLGRHRRKSSATTRSRAQWPTYASSLGPTSPASTKCDGGRRAASTAPRRLHDEEAARTPPLRLSTPSSARPPSAPRRAA